MRLRDNGCFSGELLRSVANQSENCESRPVDDWESTTGTVFFWEMRRKLLVKQPRCLEATDLF